MADSTGVSMSSVFSFYLSVFLCFLHRSELPCVGGRKINGLSTVADQSHAKEVLLNIYIGVFADWPFKILVMFRIDVI